MNDTINDSLKLIVKDISPHVYYSIGTTFSIIFMFGLLENVTVLKVYHSCEQLHIKTNMWIIAVIYCDLFIMLNAFPFVIISSYSKGFIFGYYGCQWDGFIVTTLGTTSMFLLTGLSLQRYLIMTSTLKSTMISRFKIRTAIGICFLFGLFWGSMPLIGWGSFELEGIGISCAPDWNSRTPSNLSFTIAMYLVVFLFPVFILIFCYLSILLKIWKEKKMRSAWIQKRSVIRDVKVTLSVAFVILSFIISWTPYAVVSLLTALFKMNLGEISPVIVQLPCLMAKAACIWNPLVYVCHNREFRKAFMKKFRQWNKSPSFEVTNVLQNDSYNRPNTFKRISSAAKEIGSQIRSIGERVKNNELETNFSERVTQHRPRDAAKPEMIVMKEAMLLQKYIDESSKISEV